jgi:hypothetical protein
MIHRQFDQQIATGRLGIHPISTLVLITACCVGIAAAHAGFAQSGRDFEPRTEAAVIAADDGWGEAEDAGNSAFVDALLLPEYRSISSDGSVHDKAAILASVKKRAGTPSSAADTAKWKVAHPSRTSVVITGDTAILTFTLNRPGAPASVLSSDIFIYRAGHWHALYSQHSEAEKG